MFDDIINWFKQLSSGKNIALLSGKTKIPDKSNFESKFDKIKDNVVVIQEVKIEEPIEEPLLQSDKEIEEKEKAELIKSVDPEEIFSFSEQLCTNCGNKTNSGDIFCMNCGTKLISFI